MKPRVRDHYHAHRLSYWLNLIPRLHTSGDANVSVEHHKLKDHDNANTYDGIVRNNPALIGTGRSIPHSKVNMSDIPTVIDHQNETRFDGNISMKFDSKETELISKLERENITHFTGGHRGYSTALLVTIGVGCALLVANILIFIAIYYQKEKDNLEKKLQKNFFQVHIILKCNFY